MAESGFINKTKFEIFDNVASIIFVTDVKNGRILYANSEAEKLTLFDKSELSQKIIFDFFQGNDKKKVKALIDLKSKEKDSQISENDIYIVRKNKKKVIVSVSVNELSDDSARLITIFDNTHIKTIENQLKEAQASLVESEKFKSLGILAGGIAHEINNPLAIVQVSAEIIELENNNPEISEKIETIIRASKRISKIVKSLRDYSREKSSDEIYPVSVNSIISDTLIFCNERIKTFGINLEYFPKENDFFVLGNPTLLSQVLLNLINNSVDAIHPNCEKWIKIEVEQKDNIISLSVTDSGKGIKDDISKKIMDPFFTTKPIGQGTGLGLSLSRGIIESLEGRLFYNSKCKNTKFTISLSCATKQMMTNKRSDELEMGFGTQFSFPIATKAEMEAMKDNSKNHKILVVEDEPDLQSLYVERIEQLGFQAISVSSGNEALKTLETQEVDLIISDVRMKDGDGFHLLNSLCDQGSITPFIFLTGSENLELTNFFDGGAQAVFYKPANFSALEKCIVELINVQDSWHKRDLRVEWNFPILITNESGVAIDARIVNIGQGGFCVSLKDKVVQSGENLEFQFSTPDQHGSLRIVKGRGQVKWMTSVDKSGYKFGVKMGKLSGSSRKVFIEFVNSMFNGRNLNNSFNTNKKAS